jgi:O-antigen ligase
LNASHLLLAFVALVPLLPLRLAGGSDHDASRVTQLAVLLLMALAWGWGRLQNGRLNPTIRPLHALSAVGLALASAVASAVPTMAMRELALALGLAGAVFATADGLATDGRRLAGHAVLLASALYAALLAALLSSSLLTGEPMIWSAATIGYDHYRFFNHVQTIAIPLLAWLATSQRPRSARAAAWFALVVNGTYVLCSGARGTAVAIAAGLAVAAVLAGGARCRRMALTLGIAACASGVAYLLIFVALPSLGWYSVSSTRSAESMASDSARMLLWRLAWEQAWTAPWLGIGPMHYAHAPNSKAAHPHNIYLQIAAEWGLPMLLGVLAVTGRGILALARRVRAATTAREEGTALLVTCLALLADAAVSGSFVMPVSQMWIALTIGWAIAWAREEPPADHGPPAERSSFWSVRLLAAVLIISQLFMVLHVRHEAMNLSAHLEAARANVNNPKTNPRFWSHGWF